MRQAVCHGGGSRSVRMSTDIRLFLRHAMSAQRKHAQANRQVAKSVVQLSGVPSMRATPPPKISSTIRTRNVPAITTSSLRMTASVWCIVVGPSSGAFLVSGEVKAVRLYLLMVRSAKRVSNHAAKKT